MILGFIPSKNSYFLFFSALNSSIFFINTKICKNNKLYAKYLNSTNPAGISTKALQISQNKKIKFYLLLNFNLSQGFAYISSNNKQKKKEYPMQATYLNHQNRKKNLENM